MFVETRHAASLHGRKGNALVSIAWGIALRLQSDCYNFFTIFLSFCIKKCCFFKNNFVPLHFVKLTKVKCAKRYTSDRKCHALQERKIAFFMHVSCWLSSIYHPHPHNCLIIKWLQIVHFQGVTTLCCQQRGDCLSCKMVCTNTENLCGWIIQWGLGAVFWRGLPAIYLQNRGNEKKL